MSALFFLQNVFKIYSKLYQQASVSVIKNRYKFLIINYNKIKLFYRINKFILIHLKNKYLK